MKLLFKKNWIVRLIFIFWGTNLLLSGCSNIGTPTPTPTPSYTIAVIPAEVNTQVLAINSTQTPIPTPTKTLLQSTPKSSYTPVPPFVNIRIRDVEISPDGETFASAITYNINNVLFTALKITNHSYQPDWTIENYEQNDSMIYTIPWPLAWSKDGRYLYYTHRMGGGDGCFGESDFFGKDLYKVDIQSGQTNQIVPPVGYWLALSPSQKFLAYLGDEEKLGDVLVIRDLETGKERKTEIIEGDQYPENVITFTSNLIWSPDEKSLIYTYEVNICSMEDDTFHSIVKVNIDDLSHQILVFEDKNRPFSVKWTETGKVLLRDENNNLLWLDPTSGQITEAKQ